MKNHPGRILAFSILLLTGTVPALAAQESTATLRGALVDSISGEPLYFVRLYLEGTEREFQTDQGGMFEIADLGLGHHELTMYLNGYDLRAFEFDITAEYLRTVDVGVLGLAPIPSHFINLRGRILDVNTNDPLEEAIVTISGRASAETDNDGWFEIANHEVLEGTEPIFVRRIGYESMTYPVRVVDGRTDFELDLRMQPLAIRLDDIVVEGRPVPRKLEHFFRRRSQADGQYLTPWEIEKIPARHITEILGTMPGVLITPGSYPSQNRVRIARGCRESPRLIVDGIEVRNADFNVVSHLDASAIEVYNSASRTPIQFQRNSARESCGTILIWTK
jgi:hypothetical protein